MLEQIDTLPRAEGHSPADDGNAQAGLRERCTNVRGHIIRALGAMAITGIALRCDPLEIVREIEQDVWIGVLLNHQ